MKVKGKKKIMKKKLKNNDYIKNEENNYHQKIIKEEGDKSKDKIDEDTIKDKLDNIYKLIQNNKYDIKPIDIYIKMNDSPLVNQDNKKILSKIESITQYKLISPIELIYKYNYETKNKISNEKDKCSICQYIFYFDEEEKEGHNSKKFIL